MLSVLLLAANLAVLGIVPDTMPPHVLHLVNNGTEIVLSGGFNVGTAAAPPPSSTPCRHRRRRSLPR